MRGKIPLVVGISCASGAIYGVRLLEALSAKKIPAHLIISKSATLTLKEELTLAVEKVRALAETTYQKPISERRFRLIFPHTRHDYRALLYPHAFRHRLWHNGSLLSRAADVTLKERRRLVLVVREAPLHAGHLRSMLTVTESGGTIVPPVPAFYHRPKTVDDIVNQTVGRCLDLFEIDVGLVKRWRTEDGS